MRFFNLQTEEKRLLEAQHSGERVTRVGTQSGDILKGCWCLDGLGKPRLAVVFCPLDYLCSMETAEVDSRAPLASRRSSDVYRFMTNMFIYQMRQRAMKK